MLATGSHKAEAVAAALDGPDDRGPAGLAPPVGGSQGHLDARRIGRRRV